MRIRCQSYIESGYYSDPRSVTDYVGHEQCYQIGRFLKILCVQFFLKSSSNGSRPFGLFENITLQVKTAVASFWATFAKNGLFLFQHLVTLNYIRLLLLSLTSSVLTRLHFFVNHLHRTSSHNLQYFYTCHPTFFDKKVRRPLVAI